MKRAHPLTILCILASAAGFAFAAVSTADFVAHLDRQVHGIHCSFLPGLSAADTSGESGCHVTLMSPYSSVLRSSIWGGIPVAMPAMAVFAFLSFWCAWLIVNGRERDPRATGFLFAATLVPALTSAVMGYLSIAKLDAACKLCIGIYVSSAVVTVSGLLLWLFADKVSKPGAPTPPEGDGARRGNEGEKQAARRSSSEERSRPLAWSGLGLAFAAGVGFVAVPVVAYAAAAPDFSAYVGSCGALPHPNHDARVLLPYGPQQGRTEMLEVLDPLCPSCKGFEERFSAMGTAADVDRKLLLFPLDESCNWMIDRSIHPGACSVSEAVLCSEDPGVVLRWAFENQEAIIAASAKDPHAAERMARERFPTLSGCIGSAEAQAKLNLALRWAVKNRLQVLTPQVFVEGTRLCGEDTDLGLDYALPRLIARVKNQPRLKRQPESEPASRTQVRAASPRPERRQSSSGSKTKLDDAAAERKRPSEESDDSEEQSEQAALGSGKVTAPGADEPPTAGEDDDVADAPQEQPVEPSTESTPVTEVDESSPRALPVQANPKPSPKSETPPAPAAPASQVTPEAE